MDSTRYIIFNNLLSNGYFCCCRWHFTNDSNRWKHNKRNLHGGKCYILTHDSSVQSNCLCTKRSWNYYRRGNIGNSRCLGLDIDAYVTDDMVLQALPCTSFSFSPPGYVITCSLLCCFFFSYSSLGFHAIYMCVFVLLVEIGLCDVICVCGYI